MANTANADTTVQVQVGDSLSKYAQQYQTSVNAIVQRNQLANPNLIYVGQKLIIPDSATRTTEKAATTTSSNTTSTSPLESAANTSSNLVTAAVNSASQVTLTTSTTNNDTTTAASADVSDSTATASTANATSATTAVSSAQTSVTSQTSASPVASTTTTYAANSAAAHQAMANYRIQYGTVEKTAAVVNTSTPTTTTTSTSQTTSNSGQSTSNTSTSQTTTTSSQDTSSAVVTAKSMIGVPYVWGGNTPSGFDCSGLVQYSYNLGSNYRTTSQQATLGEHKYDVENAQSGDIYFWGTESSPYHVAIAEGNGNYIQAPTPGQSVQEGNIQYYRPNYYISMNQ